MTNEEINYCLNCGIWTSHRYKGMAQCLKCQDKLKQREKNKNEK